MPRTVAIVQARMGSKRFPGKMMAQLGDAPILEWVLTRLKAARRLDDIVLATTDRSCDRVLADVAENIGISVFCGSEADVLGRFVGAAKASGAQWVVRICADRPLVDPLCVDMAIDHFSATGPDLGFNHISEADERWPRGFGAEVLSAELLRWMDLKTVDSFHREHVTQHAWKNRSYFNIVPVGCPKELDPGFADLRFDVDLPEDLSLLQGLCAGVSMSVTAGEIVERWRKSQAARAAGA